MQLIISGAAIWTLALEVAALAAVQGFTIKRAVVNVLLLAVPALLLIVIFRIPLRLEPSH